jgi:hypothetical protein
MGVIFSRKWLRSGTEEAVRPWRRWYGQMLLFNTVVIALAQAFNLARSLGALQSVNRLTLAHGIVVVTGIFMMLAGNMLPKMPWLSARFRPFRLDPWQWNRQMRFVGKLMVGMGLFLTLVLLLLPQRMAFPALAGTWLIAMIASLWHRAKVKREP